MLNNKFAGMTVCLFTTTLCLAALIATEEACPLPKVLIKRSGQSETDESGIRPEATANNRA